MAVTLGVSSGFVVVAPTDDPNGGATTTIDGSSVVTKDTSPSYATKITEIGWYRSAGTNSSNFEVALYADSSGVAATRLYVDNTNSDTSGGWVRVTVDWTISGNTAYWLAVQMDAHAGSSSIDRDTSGGSGYDILTGQSTLADPYGGGAVSDADGLMAIYALLADRQIVLGTATATATGIAITIDAPEVAATVNLNTAVATATPVALDVVPGAVAIALETAQLWFASSRNRAIDLSTATLTATGIPVTPQIITAVTVTLSTAVATATGVAITLDVPDVSVQDVELYYPSLIALDTASLTGTPVPFSVDAPITRVLDTAQATATPIPLSIDAPVTVALDTASITATPIPLTVDAPITRAMDTASLTATGITLSVDAPITRAMATGTLTATGIPITISAIPPGTTVVLSTAAITATGITSVIVPGAVAKTIQTASLTATGIPLTISAIPPGITVTLATAQLTATGINAEIDAPISRTMATASLTATGIPAEINAPVTVVLGTATITASGVNATISAISGQSVTLDTASLAASAIGLDVIPGAVSIALATGQMSASGVNATISAGAASQTVSLNTASVTASGIDFWINQTTVLDTGAVTVTGIGLDVVPGAVSILLDTVTLTATAVAGYITPPITDWITIYAPARSFILDAPERVGLSLPSAPILLTDGNGLSTTDGTLLLFTDSTDTGIGLYAPSRSFVLSAKDRE